MQAPENENRKLSVVELALAGCLIGAVAIVTCALIIWVQQTFGDAGIYALASGAAALFVTAVALR